MEIKYFDSGFVGKAVRDTNEAIKCYNAGMDIRLVDGRDFLWLDDEDNEPGESEIISRIIKCIKDNGKVYVGFELEGQKVVPKNSTNLTCDIKPGQTVYFLRFGEIISGTVGCISLSTNKKIEEYGQWKCKDVLMDCAHINDVACFNKVTGKINIIESMFIENCVLINDKKRGSYYFYPLDKVFATKDDLVESLLSKSE